MVSRVIYCGKVESQKRLHAARYQGKYPLPLLLPTLGNILLLADKPDTLMRFSTVLVGDSVVSRTKFLVK